MRFILLIVCLMFLRVIIYAQCPDRTVLRERIYSLIYSDVPDGQQLKELLPVSVQLDKCPQTNDSVKVLLLQRIGALYYLTGRFKDAATYTLNAIDLLHQKSNTYTDTTFLVRAYYFLHIYFDSLKMVSNKMNALDSSIRYALSAKYADHQILLFNLWQRSAYALDIGDFQSCVNYSSIGESITKKYALPAESNVYMMNFFSNRISSLIGLNDLASAEKDLNKKIGEYISSGFENECGSFYNLLSVVARSEGEYKDALKYLRKSLACNKKNKLMLQCKQTVNNIGYLYLNYENDPAMALSYFRQALPYKSSFDQEFLSDEIETANVLANVGVAYSRMNLYDSAFYYFQKAFDVIGKGSNEETISNMTPDNFVFNPRLNYVVSLVREKGTSYAKRFQESGHKYDIDEAIRIFQAADRILTKLKAAQTELQSKLVWRKNARVLYEQAINACYIARRPQDAFYFFERSRAVLLNDQISLNRSLSTFDINSRSQIELKIDQLKTQLGLISNDGDNYTEIQKKILFLTQQRDRINAQKTNADTARLTLTDFKRNYNLKGETILEIFTGDSSVFVLSITHNSIQIKKVDREKFDSLSTRFISFVADPVKSNTDYNDFLSVSNRLYHLMFDSVQIDGRLIISPDENNFPFEALVTKINKGKPEYLINEYTISYTYSAGFLKMDFGLKGDESTPLILGMAPVDFPAKYNLASLQASDESLKRITNRFSASQSVVRSAATKSEFLNSFYKFNIVQLYTHGAETGNAGVPVIYFADSALNLFDLIPVNKPATQLVVLSACETAKGRYYKGEGVFSFNRAFAEAGIPSSMVNLWSVDNQSSYRLTELFYKYLSKNMGFDEALRQAKIEFIKTSDKERSLPFYWAATVLAGRSSALNETNKFPWVAVAGIVLLAIGLVIVSVRYFIREEPYRPSNTEQYW